MGFKIRFAIPGPTVGMDILDAVLTSTTGVHEVKRVKSTFAAANFNMCWCDALNSSELGECTHFVMLHSDCYPQEAFWIDILAEDIEKAGVALVSVPIAIKDMRGVMSCGLLDPEDDWTPFRRLTAKELMRLPPVFGADEMGYPGYGLAHNNGCWIADLRFPQWRETDEDGNLKAQFNFRSAIYRHPDTGLWTPKAESEDWYFARMVHELGLPSRFSRRVSIWHQGVMFFVNDKPWGDNEHDLDTKHKWGWDSDRQIAAVGMEA